MRTLTTSNNVEIKYPEAIVWMGDNNWIDLTNTQGLGVAAQLDIGMNGNNYTKTYASELATERFYLDDVLRMNTPATVTVKITVTANGTTDIVTVTFKLLYGRTLATRHHGSATSILLPAGTTATEMYTPLEQGRIMVASWLAPLVFSAAGVLALNNVADGDLISIWDNSTSPVSKYFGELWSERYATSHSNIEVRTVCPAADGLVVQYYDTDGCLRYLTGRVLSVKKAAKNAELVRYDSVINNIGKRRVSEFTDEITIGVEDVPRGAYLEDVMLSQVVQVKRGGEWIDILPETLTVTKDLTENESDYKFTFKAQC